MLIYLHQILSLNKCCLVFFQVISSPMLNFQCEAFLLSSKCISLDIKYVIPACSALLIKVMHFGVAYKFKHISSFVIAYSNFFFFFLGCYTRDFTPHELSLGTLTQSIHNQDTWYTTMSLNSF
jgi:hypothetical protein